MSDHKVSGSDDGLARVDASGEGLSGDVASNAVSPALAAAVELLDAEELAYFRLNHLEGLPRARCAAELGWPAAKVARVRRRLNLHLAKLRSASPPIVLPAPLSGPADAVDGDGAGILERKPSGGHRAISGGRIYSFSRGSSLNPWFRERLSDGSSLWALSPSGEREFPNLPIIEAPISRKVVITMTLEQQLKTESAKLARIGERVHSARVALEAAERELHNARVEFDGEMSAAVLEDREPNTDSLQKKVAKLESVLSTRQKELAGAADALSKQQSTVDKLADEIKAGARHAMILRTLPQFQKLAQLQDELFDLSDELWSDFIQHCGGGYSGAEVFPESRDSGEMALRVNLLTGTLNLRNYLAGFTDSKYYVKHSKLA